MVAFTKLLAAGAFLSGTISAFPTPNSDGDILSTASSPGESYGTNSEGDLIQRQNGGRQLLQWSPSGTVVYLLGNLGDVAGALPLEIQKLITGYNNGPGAALVADLRTYLTQSPATLSGATTLFSFGPLLGTCQVGSLQHIGTAGFRNMWGFAMTMLGNNVPHPADLAALIDGITRWAQQDGGQILVQQMPNGFFPISLIGSNITKRSRTATCPAPTSLLKYSTMNVPTDINFARDIRWTPDCLR